MVPVLLLSLQLQLSRPAEPSVRVLHPSNKTFERRLGQYPIALQMLQVVGFVQQPGGELVAAGELDEHSLNLLLSSIQSTLKEREGEADIRPSKRNRVITPPDVGKPLARPSEKEDSVVPAWQKRAAAASSKWTKSKALKTEYEKYKSSQRAKWRVTRKGQVGSGWYEHVVEC